MNLSGNMVAVVTGDVVHSTRLADRSRLLKSLKYVFGELENEGWIRPGHHAVFKGDSFQVITTPSDGFAVMLILRSAFLGSIFRFASPLIVDEMLQVGFDVRLSCGIGTVEELSEPITEAYGEAFILSGKMLDYLQDLELRLLHTTRSQLLNGHFEMVCRLTDMIVKDWTERSARAICRRLLYRETQQTSAAVFGISQSSVQHRLKIGHFDEISYLLTYFEAQIEAFIKNPDRWD